MNEIQHYLLPVIFSFLWVVIVVSFGWWMRWRHRATEAEDKVENLFIQLSGAHDLSDYWKRNYTVAQDQLDALKASLHREREPNGHFKKKKSAEPEFEPEIKVEYDV